jgi:trimeric autotransporter adhesin
MFSMSEAADTLSARLQSIFKCMPKLLSPSWVSVQRAGRVLLAAGVLFASLFFATQLEAVAQVGTTQPIADLLDEQGRLINAETYAGGIDVSGYEMYLGQSGEPIFAPVDEVAANASSSNQYWQTGFERPGPGANSTIRSILVTPDGAIYVGGDFTFIGGISANRIARWDGESWHALGTGLNGTVNAVAVASNGQVYVGGLFSEAGGQPASRVARWNGSSWLAMGSGMNSDVAALAIDASGTVYAGGDFTTAGGSAANRIARWNGSSWSSMGSGMNAFVRAIAISQAGMVVVGGDFTTAGGVSAARVARWTGSAWAQSGNGLNNSVYALAFDGQVRLHAGGEFTIPESKSLGRLDGSTWVGAAPNDYLSRVRALATLPDGRLIVGADYQFCRFRSFRWECDPSEYRVYRSTAAGWESRTTGGSEFMGGQWRSVGAGVVSAVASLPTGEVIFGGTFNQMGSLVVGRLAKWLEDGVSFVGRGLDGRVTSVVAAPDGGVYIGGLFRNAGQSWARRIVHYRDGTWTDLGGGLAGAPNVMIVSENGDLYVGGSFQEAGGVAVSNVARWNGTTWTALGAGVNGTVNALAFDSNGRLYVAGAFTSAGGASANRVARWDGSIWSALGSGVNQIVSTIHVDPSSGDVFAGGGFTEAGGQPALRIARWDGSAWHAFEDEPNSSVNAIISDGRGGIYIAGFFTQVGGHQVNRVAHWDGTTWTALNNGADATVRDVAVDAHGHLYIAGDFTSVNGKAASRVAVWNGYEWSALASGVNGISYALTFDSNGHLFVGGDFTSAGFKSSVSLAEWNGPPPFRTPALAAFSPLSGPVGTVVTLQGTAFSDVTDVRFGGASATFAVVSDTQITAVVPEGAPASSPIYLSSQGGSAEGPSAFQVSSTVADFVTLPDGISNTLLSGLGLEIFMDASSTLGLTVSKHLTTPLGLPHPFSSATDRYWSITTNDATDFEADICFLLDELEIDDPAGLSVLSRTDSDAPWGAVAAELRDEALCATGLTAFSDFALVNSACNDHTTVPFWDGEIASAANGSGYFVIDVPTGFQRVELLTESSQNITLLAPGDEFCEVLPGVSATGELRPPGITAHGTGSTEWMYDGDVLTTRACIRIANERAGESSFMIRVYDQCGRYLQVDPLISLASDIAEIPQSYALDANYPNPFNPTTTIRYHLPESASVSLTIYDMTGRRVRQLVSGTLDAGIHTASWDGSNESGALVASGVYFYRIEAGSFVQTRSMTLVK